MELGIERRRHKRFPVDNVHGTVVLKSDARVLNISVVGMTLETNHSLRTGRPLTVTMGDDGNAIRVTGTVVRCDLVGTHTVASGEIEPVFNAGLQLEGMLSERAEEILAFMRQHARIEVDRRVFGRFKLHERRSVRVEAECPFQVLTLSLSGMRVEAERAPEMGDRVDLDLDLHEGCVHAGARVVAVTPAQEGRGRAAAHLVDLEFGVMADQGREQLQHFISAELEVADPSVAPVPAGPDSAG